MGVTLRQGGYTYTTSLDMIHDTMAGGADLLQGRFSVMCYMQLSAISVGTGSRIQLWALGKDVQSGAGPPLLST